MHVHVKCIYIFPNSVHQEGIEANETPVAKSTPGVQNLVLNAFLNKSNYGASEEELILGLKQEKYVVSPKHHIVPESKEMGKNGEHMKGHKSQTGSSQ